MSVDTAIIEGIGLALKKVKLEAVVVGNTASALHGAPVLTEDVDIVIRDTALNKKKMVALAKELGGSNPTDISDMTRTKRILLPEAYLDVMFGSISGGLGFEALRARSKKIHVGDAVLTVASLKDVIKSKRAANRQKDIAVLPILQHTLEINGDK